jgi:hypothetical protein
MISDNQRFLEFVIPIKVYKVKPAFADCALVSRKHQMMTKIWRQRNVAWQPLKTLGWVVAIETPAADSNNNSGANDNYPSTPSSLHPSKNTHLSFFLGEQTRNFLKAWSLPGCSQAKD